MRILRHSKAGAQPQPKSVSYRAALTQQVLNVAIRVVPKKGYAKFLVTCLLVAISTAVFVARPRRVARAATQAGPEHVLSFPYYSIKGDWDSTLTLNNSLDSQLAASGTLYSLDGDAMQLPNFTVPPSSSVAVHLGELLTRTANTGRFQEGSIELRFNGTDAMGLGAQLTVLDPTHGLSFDMEPPMMLMSSKLEGLWWSLDKKTSAQVMLSNTTGGTLDVLLSAEWRGTVIPTEPISLSAHQTVVLEIEKLLNDLHIEAEGIERGGLSITHNGPPGALIAHGLIKDKERHFASNLNFIDPAGAMTSVLDGTGLMLGHPGPGAFPQTSFFTPRLVFKNASPASQTATVTVKYTVEGVLRTRTLPQTTLAPHEVRVADFSALMAELGNVRVTVAGLRIESSGKPGSLVAELSSVDQAQSSAVDVPLISVNLDSVMGGSHPFRIDPNSRSVAYLTNVTTKRTKVMIIILYTGGQYTPELVPVAPGETVAVDLLQLRDSRAKDVQGRTLPGELTEGQFFWRPHQKEAMIGRVLIVDKTSNTASNFSCPNCCGQDFDGFQMVPANLNGVVGDFQQMTIYEWDNWCHYHGILYGPYNVTSECQYWSDNTAVATVSSTGGVTCVNLGSTAINISMTTFSTDFDGFDCRVFESTSTDACPITVFRLRIRVAGSSIHFEDSDSGASIVAGETFAIIAEAINAVGDILPINVPVSTSVSRMLDSSEIGLPSSFKIKNGSYNSGGLLLNRVTATQSGTSYRFSTNAGGFKDFFLYTYFQVVSTREGLVGGLLWCGGTVQPNDHFVSLPVAELCGVSVVVRNPSTGQSETTTKKDKGPHFPGPRTPCDPDGSIGGDFYWNTGTRPRVESLTCEDGNNNAGIDLADGTFAAVGSPSQVVWRFGS